MTHIIFAYNRHDAIRDGVLVDVTDLAEQAGFKLPVALTRTVWDRYVEVPITVQYQEQRDRLWDILWTLKQAVNTSPWNDAILHFRVLVDYGNGRRKFAMLKAVCGPDDDHHPVITIMLPGEN